MTRPDLAVALNEIERRLRARREALAESLRDGEVEPGLEPDADEPGSPGPPLSGRSSELAAIDRALESLSRGEYAACRECGQPIGPTRLLAVPLAEGCAACQSLREMPSHHPAATALPPGVPEEEA